MMTHIVFLKLKQKSDAAEVKKRLSILPAQIPEIQTYEIGIDEVESPRSFHMSLYSQFESYDTLKIYNEHPAHQAVLAYIREVADTVHAVDYTNE